MELAFATKMLRDICESEVLANQMFGAKLAKSLKSRLADLRAAAKVSQLPIGNPRQIMKCDKEYIEIDLCNVDTLVICANHNNNPQLADGKIDWSVVYHIKICSIGGYCD